MSLSFLGRVTILSENMNLAVHRLIGPRIFHAGCCVTLDDSGVGAVTYPTVPGLASQYCVLLSSDSPTYPYWGSFSTSGFSITGGVGANVCWALVKLGLGGSPAGVNSNLANT